jgi:hypothetical protein
MCSHREIAIIHCTVLLVSRFFGMHLQADWNGHVHGRQNLTTADVDAALGLIANSMRKRYLRFSMTAKRMIAKIKIQSLEYVHSTNQAVGGVTPTSVLLCHLGCMFQRCSTLFGIAR